MEKLKRYKRMFIEDFKIRRRSDLLNLIKKYGKETLFIVSDDNNAEPLPLEDFLIYFDNGEFNNETIKKYRGLYFGKRY